MSQFFWDDAKWDQAEWAGGPPPGPGWGDDWAWWYQVAAWAPAFNLDPLLVEARWTTQVHTLGDGTFRGDLQPGTITVRLWDPTHELDHLDKTGAVFALYKPTGACWCWFYESFSRGLYAPGDPAAADCVFVGTEWPTRLTTPTLYSNYPSQSASARLAAVVASWVNPSPGLILPHVTGNIATQNQTVLATVMQSGPAGWYPGWMQVVRDAAADGVAWMAAAPVTVGSSAGGGRLILNYARWETNTQRILDRSQIVAGPPTTAAATWMITAVQWAATDAAGTQTTDAEFSSNLSVWGQQGPSPMRLWGSVSSSGPEHTPAVNTAKQLMADRSDASEQQLSSISLQSGTRWTATGKPSAADWDPYAHVFSPTDVAVITDDKGTQRRYRVQKSDHRLTSAVWQTTHYLEKYTAPVPLP